MEPKKNKKAKKRKQVKKRISLVFERSIELTVDGKKFNLTDKEARNLFSALESEYGERYSW